MSQDAWLVVKAVPAPVESLPALFEDLWMEDGDLMTLDSETDCEVVIGPVALEEAAKRLPEGTLASLGRGASAFHLSGRRFSHFDLNVLDVLAPQGGFFIYEEGEVEALEPATAPEAIMAASAAASTGQIEELIDISTKVPQSDWYRLPLKAIAGSLKADPSLRARLGGIAELCLDGDEDSNDD